MKQDIEVVQSLSFSYLFWIQGIECKQKQKQERRKEENIE